MAGSRLHTHLRLVSSCARSVEDGSSTLAMGRCSPGHYFCCFRSITKEPQLGSDHPAGQQPTRYVEQQHSQAVESTHDLPSVTGANSPTADSGVILLSSRSYSDAVKTCHGLNEDLWSPGQDTESTQRILDYLLYEGEADVSTQFWVAPQDNSTRALSVSGNVSTVQPGLELPALCTQSAPFANATHTDTSKKWQVSVHSNNDEIVGYVTASLGSQHCVHITANMSPQVPRPHFVSLLRNPLCPSDRPFRIFSPEHRIQQHCTRHILRQ